MSQRRFLIYLLIISALLSYLTYYGPTKRQSEEKQSLESSSKPMSEIIIDFSSPNALEEWKPHHFNKSTLYEVKDTGEKFLSAVSHNTSSALFHEVNLEMNTQPVFVWRWRVEKFPPNKKENRVLSDGDNNFAAKIYAVFEGRNRLSHDVIQYVWDENFPVETSADKSSLNRIKVLVVHSGPAEASGAWAQERRDLAKDYERLYGKPVGNKRLLIIGLLTESEGEGAESEARYRDFRFEFPAHKVAMPVKKKKQKLVSSPFSFIAKIPAKTKNFGALLVGKKVSPAKDAPKVAIVEDSKTP